MRKQEAVAAPLEPNDRRVRFPESATGEPATGASRVARLTRSRTILMLPLGVAIGAITVVAWFLWPGQSFFQNQVASTKRFDASAVPLVNDEVRRSLASYPSRPDAKALAIANEGWSVVDSAPDIETAGREAVHQCAAKANGRCRIYAAGMDVV